MLQTTKRGKGTIGAIGVDKYPANALSMAKSTDGGASAITFKGLMAISKEVAIICNINIWYAMLKSKAVKGLSGVRDKHFMGVKGAPEIREEVLEAEKGTITNNN